MLDPTRKAIIEARETEIRDKHFGDDAIIGLRDPRVAAYFDELAAYYRQEDAGERAGDRGIGVEVS